MDLFTPFRPAAYRKLISLLRLAMETQRRWKMEVPSGLGDHAWTLYGLVRSMRPEVCVEIGSALGKSACHMGMALKENGRGKLYAIDPHEATAWNDEKAVNSLEAMRKNLREYRVSDQVEIVREYSGDAARGWSRTIDLLFIDGDHSYDGCKSDWDLFVPHMSKFGIVVFHDTAWEVAEVDERWRRADMGVPRFVDELRQRGCPVLTIPTFCGLSLVQPTIGGVDLLHKTLECADRR